MAIAQQLDKINTVPRCHAAL